MDTFSHRIVWVEDKEKCSFLMDLLHAAGLHRSNDDGNIDMNNRTIVFVDGDDKAEKLKDILHQKGFMANEFKFRSNLNRIIITTISVIGLPFDELSKVKFIINFDFPSCENLYTLRFDYYRSKGNKGLSISFFNDNDKNINTLKEFETCPELDIKQLSYRFLNVVNANKVRNLDKLNQLTMINLMRKVSGQQERLEDPGDVAGRLENMKGELRHASRTTLVEKLAHYTQEKELSEEMIVFIKDKISAENKSEFECPVCIQMMSPPKQIWQCENGHLICDVCKDNPSIKSCPSCRQKIIGRCRPMERVAATWMIL